MPLFRITKQHKVTNPETQAGEWRNLAEYRSLYVWAHLKKNLRRKLPAETALTRFRIVEVPFVCREELSAFDAIAAITVEPPSPAMAALTAAQANQAEPPQEEA